MILFDKPIVEEAMLEYLLNLLTSPIRADVVPDAVMLKTTVMIK